MSLPADDARFVTAQSFHRDRKQVALIEPRYKLIVDMDVGTRQLYDLTRDRRERENLIERRPDEARRMAQRLRAFTGSLETPAAGKPTS